MKHMISNPTIMSMRLEPARNERRYEYEDEGRCRWWNSVLSLIVPPSSSNLPVGSDGDDDVDIMPMAMMMGAIDRGQAAEMSRRSRAS